MTNSLFKKGLISAVAASAAVGALFAASSVNTPAVVSFFSNGGDSNFTVNEINISETLVSGVPTSGTASLTVTIPSNVKLADIAGNDINYTNITSSGFIYVEQNGSTATASSSLWIDTNGTGGRYKLLDLNESGGAGKLVLARDTNASAFQLMSIAGLALDNNVSYSTSLGGLSAAADVNKTKLANVTKATDGSVSFTLNLKSTSDSALDSLQIKGLKLIPASTSSAGDTTISFVGSGGISSHDVKVAALQTNVAKIDANTTVSSTTNISNDTSTAGAFADFNITIPSNLATTVYKGKLAVKLANGKFVTATIKDDSGYAYIYRGDSNSTGISEGNYTTADSNSTLVIDRNLSTSKTINISGTVKATATTAGTNITVNFSTATDTNLSSDRNFSSLASYGSTATALKIANIVTDGVKIELKNSAKTAANSIVVPGVSFQTVNTNTDINISEYFITSFAAGKTISLTLPSGYTWAAKPTITNTMLGTAIAPTEQSGVNPSGDTYTIQFGANAESNSTLETNASSSYMQTITVGGMQINVPSTAKDGDVVNVAIAGTLFTSSKSPSVSSIGIATVKTTTATVSSDNNASSDTYTFATSTSSGSTALNLKVKEAISGVAQPGTITVKLSGGAKWSSAGSNPSQYAVAGNPFTINYGSTTYADSNATMTMLVTASGTAGGTDANTTITLPKVDFSSVTSPAKITATVAGTSGISGTIDIANLVYGNTVTTTAVALPTSTVDAYTGEVVITENLIAGLGDSKALRFIAPAGIAFTGSYNTTAKALTTSSYPDYLTTLKTGIVSTTFNTSDTIQVLTSDVSPDDATKKNIKLKFKVNIAPAAAAGYATFTIVDGNTTATTNTSGITVTSAKLVYVGSALPTFTAAPAATVAAGSTGTAVPTGAGGTVTYAVTTDNASGKITVSSSGVVTVDANATVGATATITATDSTSGQTATTVITVGAAAPMTVSGTLPLVAGWNLVTTPVNASMTAATLNDAAVTSATSGNKLVWVFNASAGTYASTGAGAYTGNVVAGQGAWIKSDAAKSVAVSGTPNTAAFDLAAMITALPTGWSVVGNSGAATTAAISGVKAAWGFDASINNWKNYSATAVTGYTSVVGVPAGTALWIEK